MFPDKPDERENDKVIERSEGLNGKEKSESLVQQHEAFLFPLALQTTEYLKPGMSFKSVRPPRSSALVSSRAPKDPKENNGSEGVLKGIKKPKDGSEGGSGGKMMGQMASKDGPEILQAGRDIRRGEE